MHGRSALLLEPARFVLHPAPPPLPNPPFEAEMGGLGLEGAILPGGYLQVTQAHAISHATTLFPHFGQGLLCDASCSHVGLPCFCQRSGEAQLELSSSPLSNHSSQA